MADVPWDIIGVIVGVIGILVTFGLYYWKRRRKRRGVTTLKKGIKEAHRPSKPKLKKVNEGVSVKKPSVESLLDERITIPKNSNIKRQFDLRCGDRIKGNAEETRGRRFSLYVMDEENYHNYQNGEDYRYEREYEDIVQTHIFVDIPYDDTWYIVFDTTYKQVDRRVNIKLQKKSK